MNYGKHATVSKTASGSWAAHVVSRLTHKKTLLGTYNTEADAKLAIEKYAHPEKFSETAAPTKPSVDDEPPPPKQGRLF